MDFPALQKLCRVVREYSSDNSMDYAVVQEAKGGICLTIGDIPAGNHTFQVKKTIAVYELLFEAEPDVIEAKIQELLGTYTQAWVYLGSRLISNK